MRHIHLLIIFLVSTAIYLNAIPNDYNLDDELVTQNHVLTSRGISALGEIFSQPYYKDAQGYSYDYRPVVLASFAIEHSIFGKSPQVSHTINVLLYGVLCILLFSCLSLLLGREYLLLSMVASLLFAVHPTHTEVVASIKNRDELLALIGALGSLRFTIQWADKKKATALLLSFLLFVLGLMSKLSITSFAVLIPISLILFRSIAFSSTLALSLVLASPFIYLSNIPQLGFRLVFIIAMMVTSIVFWYLKNNRINIKKIHVFVLQVLESTKDNITDFNVAFDTRKWMKVQNIVFPLFFLLFSTTAFLSYYLGLIIPMRGALILMLFFWLISIWEWKVFTLPFIIVFCLLILSQSGIIAVIVFDLLLVMLFILSILSQSWQRLLFTILGITVLAACIYTNFYNRFFSYIFFSSVLFLPFIPKKIRTALLIFGLSIATITSLQSILNNPTSFDYFILIVISILILQQRKKTLFHLLPISISFVILAFALFPNFSLSRHQIEPFSIIQNANKIAAPSIIEAVNRPLNFLETPVTSMSPIAIKLGTSMTILGSYLKLLFAPFPLAFYYGYSIIKETRILTPLPMLLLAFHLFLSFLGIYLIRKKPLLSWGIFVYLISIVSFLPIANPLPGMMADRYLLIPSIGFSLLIAYFLLWANQKASEIRAISTPSKLAISAILILFSIVTVARNFDWKDRLTLFENDIKHIEKSGYAQNLLGIHLALKANQSTDTIAQKRLLKKACEHFQKSIAIYPDFLNSHFDLGRTLVKLNLNDDAITEFKEAIRLQPDFSEPYINIGILLDTKGQVKEAAEYYEKGLNLNPNKLEVYANLSYAYFRLHDFKSAIYTSHKAIEIFPTAFQPYVNLGKIFYTNQQKDSALFYFEKANQVNPNQADIISALVALYAEKNDPKTQIYAEQLQRLQPAQ